MEIEIGVKFLVFLSACLYCVLHVSCAVVSHRIFLNEIDEEEQQDNCLLIWSFIYRLLFSFPNLIVCLLLYPIIKTIIFMINLFFSFATNNKIQNNSFKFKDIFCIVGYHVSDRVRETTGVVVLLFVNLLMYFIPFILFIKEDNYMFLGVIFAANFISLLLVHWSETLFDCCSDGY